VARFRRRPQPVDAIQWTGVNRDEIMRFMGDFFALDQIRLRFTRDEDPTNPDVDPRRDPGNMVLFDLYDDEGREYVQPCQWIVVEEDEFADDDDPYDHNVQIMNDGAFRHQFEPEPEPRIIGRIFGSPLTPAAPWWWRVWAVVSGAGVCL
jgi:hypothetical protein